MQKRLCALPFTAVLVAFLGSTSAGQTICGRSPDA